MKSTRSLALFALSLLPLACGGSEQPPAPASVAVSAEPAGVAEQFMRAVQDEDERGMAALVTKGARAALQDGGFELSGDRLQSFEIGAASVKGSEAEVEAVVVEDGERKSNDILLRREAGAWRVWGMRVQFGDGTFTVDLEQMSQMAAELGEQIGAGLQEAFAEAQATWEQGGSEEEIAAERRRFEAIAPVSEAEHESSWRVDVVGEGRPTIEVLSELVGSEGLSIDAGEHEDALWTPFALTLQNVSRVEAVERVAAAAGLHPIWPPANPSTWSSDQQTSSALTFGSGKRPWPVVFAGPFLVEVTGVDEHAPNAVGTLSLAVRALGLAPGALAFQDDMVEVLRLDRVRSDQELPLTDEGVSHMGTPDVRDGYFTYTLDKDLTGLLRNVRTVDAVVGEVRLPLPASVEELSWRRGDTEARHVGGWKLTVGSWSPQVRFDIEGPEGSMEGVSVRMSPRKASGDPLGMLYGGSSGWGSQLQADLQCPETPAAVDLKICTTQVVSYPFALRRIPLARSSEQPERLQELAFAGKAPILVELLDKKPADGDQWEVKLRVRNSSNKDAVSVMVEFAYLDASGNELDDFPHTLSGAYDFEAGRFGPLVPAGETVQHETQAAFVPKGAVYLRFDVQRVEFPDGTIWESER
jgi:hypothetical protein